MLILKAILPRLTASSYTYILDYNLAKRSGLSALAVNVIIHLQLFSSKQALKYAAADTT